MSLESDVLSRIQGSFYDMIIVYQVKVGYQLKCARLLDKFELPFLKLLKFIARMRPMTFCENLCKKQRSFAYIDSDTDKTSRINSVKNNNLIQDGV